MIFHSFIIQIEYTAQRNSALKPLWCNNSVVLSSQIEFTNLRILQIGQLENRTFYSVWKLNNKLT